MTNGVIAGLGSAIHARALPHRWPQKPASLPHGFAQQGMNAPLNAGHDVLA
jgi:hypothetical protein